MKNFKIILLAITVTVMMGTSSCKKYLTVNPETEIPQEQLFNTESGFKDALTGVYLQMKNDNAYGKAMTMTTIEQLTSSWDVTANTTEQRLGLFNYTDEGVAGSLSAIFSQEYKIISSVNSILGEIDNKREVFKTPGMYEVIKSECLAIRAYCHLDLLRLFGPVPTAPANGNMLAYVTAVSKTPNQRISFTAYQVALFKDLADAEALVKDVDPITKYSLTQLKNPGPTTAFNPSDTYLAYRYIRVNYYAIKALEARAYLWFNVKDKAYECAKVVIDAKNPDNTVKFALGTSADMAAQDYLLSREHIFGLYDYDLYTKYTTMYASGTLKKSTSATIINTQLYGNTGTDIREANLWQLITLANAAKCYVLKKYLVVEKPATLALDIKQIPMLRVSEMYLIGAETAPTAEAQALWTAFRTARNITTTTLPADPLQLQLEVIKEYRKEFYAEGQGFFAYKRINAPKANFLFAPTAATVNYLIPLPANETVTVN